MVNYILDCAYCFYYNYFNKSIRFIIEKQYFMKIISNYNYEQRM